MYLPKKIESAETASVLPVDTFYTLAVEKLETIHDKLDSLPKNPAGDNTPSLLALKAAFNVHENNNTDFSMFLMGGMQQMALGALTGAFGLATGAGQMLDIGSSFITDKADNDNETRKGQSNRSVFKRAATPGKSSERLSFKRAPSPASKPAAMPATHILRAAMQRKQQAAYKKTLKQRRALERQLLELKEMFIVLNT